MTGDEKELDTLPLDISKADALEIISKFLDFAIIAKQSEVEITRINAMENMMITNITLKYDLYRRFFAAKFAERGKAIDKQFEVIDRGIQNNDKELIINGLKYLSETVKSSPLADFEKFKAAFDADALLPI
jgi:hypothetical protein